MHVNLRALLDRLEAEGEDLPGRRREVVRLNQYVVAARYPGVDEPVEPNEYEDAIELAEYVEGWVITILAEGSPTARGEQAEAGPLTVAARPKVRPSPSFGPTRTTRRGSGEPDACVAKGRAFGRW